MEKQKFFLVILLMAVFILAGFAFSASALAQAQISFDNSLAANSTFFNYSVGLGDNRILFVGTRGNSQFASEVSYGGVPLTKIADNKLSGGWYFSLWYLIAPETGEHRIEILFPGGEGGGGAAVSYFGVKQNSQPDAWVIDGTEIPTNTWTTQLTTRADNVWTILLANASAHYIYAGENTTLRTLFLPTVETFLGDSNGSLSPAGNFAMTARSDYDVNWATIMASFSPSEAPAPSPASIIRNLTTVANLGKILLAAAGILLVFFAIKRVISKA